MPPATLSFTESQTYAALRTFLLSILPPGVDVVRGQVNRVAEPANPNFVVFWPLARERLGTNLTTYADNTVVGSVSGTVLTVASVTRGKLSSGMLLLDATQVIAIDTVLGQQLSGSLGGTGTYAVAPSQTVASGTIYAGVRADMEPTKLTTQLDVHGPASGDNSQRIAALFRSEYGVSALAASGLDLAPLYCDDPKQMPFINAEQEYEDRWTIDACFQVNQVIGTPQQFADELSVTLIPVPSGLS